MSQLRTLYTLSLGGDLCLLLAQHQLFTELLTDESCSLCSSFLLQETVGERKGYGAQLINRKLTVWNYSTTMKRAGIVPWPLRHRTHRHSSAGTQGSQVSVPVVSHSSLKMVLEAQEGEQLSGAGWQNEAAQGTSR